MSFLQDHLSAILLGTAVTFILAATSLTGQRSAIGAAQYASGRAAAEAFVEVMTHDFTNVGANVPPGAPAITAFTSDSLTTVFEFHGATGPSAAAPVERIRYELHRTGTVEVSVRGTVRSVPAYEVRRLVHNGTAFAVSGRSTPTVAMFAIELVGAGGAPVGAALNSARELRVRFAAAPPLGRGGPVSLVRWARRFPLHNLTGP